MKYFQNMSLNSIRTFGILGVIFKFLNFVLVGILSGLNDNPYIPIDYIFLLILFCLILELIFVMKVEENPKIIAYSMIAVSFAEFVLYFFLGLLIILYFVNPGLILSIIAILGGLNTKEKGKLSMLDTISEIKHIIKIVLIFFLLWLLIDEIAAYYAKQKFLKSHKTSYIENGVIHDCNLMESEYKKSKCITDVAISKKDVSICDEIEDDSQKYYCYGSFAVFKKDPAICDKIPNVGDKDFCYSRVAIAKKDLSLCDKIQDINRKNFCYDSVSH